MSGYIEITSPDVYFIADAHFCNPRHPSETPRRRLFTRFLETIPDNATIFLLGDIFDFYFEYGTVVSKRYFDVFYALHDCSRRGVSVHFLGGNHDSWFDSFLRDDLGLTLHGDEVLVACQGRKICCTHGDLLLPDDRGYKTIRTIIRNPIMIKAARLILHPDLMDAIAVGLSNRSKRKDRTNQSTVANRMAESANASFFSRSNDIFIMGHVHYPIHRVKGGKEFMIVGDWIKNHTYGRLRGGKLSLETFTVAEPG